MNKLKLTWSLMADVLLWLVKNIIDYYDTRRKKQQPAEHPQE
jgi:hypothetical protein